MALGRRFVTWRIIWGYVSGVRGAVAAVVWAVPQPESNVTTSTVTAPAYWASALVNGDDSGLDDKERAALEAWRSREGFPNVVDVARDDDGEAFDARFTWHYDLYSPESGYRGGEVIDYVVIQ